MSEKTIDGVRLCFYAHLRARHDGKLLSEWLLELARRDGIGGGSVFRATAGFGRHGVLHEEAFFELADNLPVKIEFLLRPEQADAFLARVREAGVDVVYATSAIRFGVLGAH
jgi:PII-like signaling protein